MFHYEKTYKVVLILSSCIKKLNKKSKKNPSHKRSPLKETL